LYLLNYYFLNIKIEIENVFIDNNLFFLKFKIL
jgi:hypothetical protein